MSGEVWSWQTGLLAGVYSQNGTAFEEESPVIGFLLWLGGENHDDEKVVSVKVNIRSNWLLRRALQDDSF